MSKLLVKPKGTHGRITKVTPKNAGWTYVGFELHRIMPGETVSGGKEDRETCLVWVTGKGKAVAGGQDFGSLGERMSPFDGPPAAVYIPAGTDWQVTAETDLELAVCSAPDRVRRPAGARHCAGEAVQGNARQGHQHALRHQHPAGGRTGTVAARGRGHHAGRAHLVLPAAQARPRRSARRIPAGGNLLPPAEPAARASPSSASIPTTVRSTRRWRWRTATSCWCPRAITPAPPATATIFII